MRSEYVSEVQHTAAQILGRLQDNPVGLHRDCSQAPSPPAFVFENQRFKDDLVVITVLLMKLEKTKMTAVRQAKKVYPLGGKLVSPCPVTVVWKVLVGESSCASGIFCLRWVLITDTPLTPRSVTRNFRLPE